jgi:hypothetical protein
LSSGQTPKAREDLPAALGPMMPRPWPHSMQADILHDRLLRTRRADDDSFDAEFCVGASSAISATARQCLEQIGQRRANTTGARR